MTAYLLLGAGSVLVVSVLLWLVLRGAQAEAVTPVDPLLARALVLTAEQERLRPESGFGESKRHQVYARLLKEFPDRPKRAVSRAIEDALT